MLNDYLVYLETQTTFSIYFDDKHGQPWKPWRRPTVKNREHELSHIERKRIFFRNKLSLLLLKIHEYIGCSFIAWFPSKNLKHFCNTWLTSYHSFSRGFFTSCLRYLESIDPLQLVKQYKRHVVSRTSSRLLKIMFRSWEVVIAPLTDFCFHVSFLRKHDAMFGLQRPWVFFKCWKVKISALSIEYHIWRWRKLSVPPNIRHHVRISHLSSQSLNFPFFSETRGKNFIDFTLRKTGCSRGNHMYLFTFAKSVQRAPQRSTFRPITDKHFLPLMNI